MLVWSILSLPGLILESANASKKILYNYNFCFYLSIIKKPWIVTILEFFEDSQDYVNTVEIIYLKYRSYRNSMNCNAITLCEFLLFARCRSDLSNLFQRFITLRLTKKYWFNTLKNSNAFSAKTFDQSNGVYLSLSLFWVVETIQQ